MQLPALMRTLAAALAAFFMLQALPALAAGNAAPPSDPMVLCTSMSDNLAPHAFPSASGLGCPDLTKLAKTPPRAQKKSPKTGTFLVIDGIEFGDDSSSWSNDGECDDPRFTGENMAVELLAEDAKHDATDCSTLYQSGAITLKPDPKDIVDQIDFGDNSSQWSDDGECDDPRFNGEGSADTLIDEDMAHDANDCRTLFLAGKVDYLGDDPDMTVVEYDGITFGDNTSQWKNDGECDDPRFAGEGMAQVLVEDDREHDAADCLSLYKSGSIQLASNTGTQQTGIDFGDDTSTWNNDGECDDPRFEGDGAASVLLDEDLGHDATDCRTLYQNGSITLKSGSGNTPSDIDFGDDTSSWANDGECDDPRFAGEGSAEVLLDEDKGHDATDCRTLYQSGDIYLAGTQGGGAGQVYDNIDFGDDSSQWSNDGECDDPRFTGEGSAEILLDDDKGHDATDCLSLYQAGKVALLGVDADGNVDFGDDSSSWSKDGQCDDPRFEGVGMAETLLADDAMHDATDCRVLYNSGSIHLAGGNGSSSGGVDFGDDTSTWSKDGECDDPRFAGDGMASTLLQDDAMHDASDCQTLYDAGKIHLVGGQGATPGSVEFGDDSSSWSNDGECDDPRFEGEGMATVLLDEDMNHDATDCSSLYNAGKIHLAGNGGTSGTVTNVEIDGIQFGDNTSDYADNGECDDPLFAGEGAASVLLDADRGHDANDCVSLYQQGRIHLASDKIEIDGIQFGDNTSTWANDGECDDSRFTGDGAFDGGTNDHVGHDAEDCSSNYQAGTVTLKAGASPTLDGTMAEGPAQPAAPANVIDGIDFGDNTALWSNDGECDDPRFEGTGMAASVDEADSGHDATDCMAAYQAGTITAK
ncbi:MAG: hypothetical protein H6873_01355 [Hyphomicrobiaceae bacterium]|nr:hypothetical protein [Hyphomicrobiaceae bacterium]